jgi:LacI family transcriptional regulator, repressor for deo operon, udp, cdd, tsx, nupC, and nupG
VLCARTMGGVSEVDFVDMLLEHQVSGIIFAGGNYAMGEAGHEHYHMLAARGLPAVLVNAGVDELSFPRVSTDDAVGVEQAYAHLVSLGHERIGALLGPADHIPSQRKLAALQAAVKASTGVEYEVERSAFSMEGGRAAAAKLVGREVTGILCASDVLALGAVRAVRRLGLRVPADVSIIGYDDSALMTCMDPPLTTVRQPIEAMGQSVVDLLVQQIGGGGVAPDELLFEPELVVRGSTAPRR